MKSLVPFLVFSMLSVSAWAADSVVIHNYESNSLTQEIFNHYPELRQSDQFIRMVSHDKNTDTKIFLSKNMTQHLPGFLKNQHLDKSTGYSLPYAVACDKEAEDEVCTTVTVNGEVKKQGSECIAKQH